MRDFDVISVIGLGYIGLPTAAVLALTGKKIIGVDVNQKAVEVINQGKVHIVEADLDQIVKDTVSSGHLKAVTKPEPADAFLIAVPTPFTKNKEADLSYVQAAAKAIAPVLKKGDLVVLESTSSVGATEQLSQWFSQYRSDLNFPLKNGDLADVNIAYCPERVLPGQVIKELVENDRVVGGLTDACSQRAVDLYGLFVKGECFNTNARTAEMTKLVENASRDVSIAFANELSVICEELDISVWELIELANHHPRVNILQPGPGVGGHCIAVDPWFIISKTPALAPLMHTARQVNDAKPQWVVDKVNKEIANYLKENSGKELSDVTIACLGLAFKPDIDDLRESPAMLIAEQLTSEHKGRVVSVEPNIDALSDAYKGKLAVLNLDDALGCADVLVLLVDHIEFKTIDRAKIRNKNIVDTRGIWKS